MSVYYWFSLSGFIIRIIKPLILFNRDMLYVKMFILITPNFSSVIFHCSRILLYSESIHPAFSPRKDICHLILCSPLINQFIFDCFCSIFYFIVQLFLDYMIISFIGVVIILQELIVIQLVIYQNIVEFQQDKRNEIMYTKI